MLLTEIGIDGATALCNLFCLDDDEFTTGTIAAMGLNIFNLGSFYRSLFVKDSSYSQTEAVTTIAFGLANLIAICMVKKYDNEKNEERTENANLPRTKNPS